MGLHTRAAVARLFIYLFKNSTQYKQYGVS